MGEKIIKVDFGGEFKNRPKEKSVKFPTNKEFETLKLFSRTLEVTQKMMEFLRTLRFVPKIETMALRQDLVGRMNMKQICEAITSSSEDDWKIHPAYYKTLGNSFLSDNAEAIKKLILENMK